MASKFQLVRRPRRRKHHKSLARGLKGCPQRRGWVMRRMIHSPKKPNSAQRKVAFIRVSTRKRVIAAIPGEMNTLQQYARVLLRGGRRRDRPGCNHLIISGVYDMPPNYLRVRQRSKSGMKRSTFRAKE